tara:strand:+ start:434 stop:757 length:324 start_codon:yes stop_codon:yes gene_type:complete
MKNSKILLLIASITALSIFVFGCDESLCDKTWEKKLSCSCKPSIWTLNEDPKFITAGSWTSGCNVSCAPDSEVYAFCRCGKRGGIAQDICSCDECYPESEEDGIWKP